MATNRTSEELLALGQRLKAEIEKRHGKSTEQLCEEREKRLSDAIDSREPDRVPVVLGGTFFAARYAGLPYSSAYYNAVDWKQAYTKMLCDFDPDAYGNAQMAEAGLALESLDTKNYRWPGGTLPPDFTYQFVEAEYMKADEYDLFLSDPTDFILRYYLPRVYGALSPLAGLPSLTDRFTGFPAMTPIFTREGFLAAARALLRAGQEQAKWRQSLGKLDEEMASLGFPSFAQAGGPGISPCDFISNNLRGVRGLMLDMYERPDKLRAACEMIVNWRIKRATPADTTKKSIRRLGAGGGIRLGSGDYVSREQFETFFWPTTKKSSLAAINLGYIPTGFAGGKGIDRLEYLLELPKGGYVVRIEQTNELKDIIRAKEILKGHACIMGGVPAPLLHIGSPQEVEEHCRKVIEICGKGGGFILRASTDFIQEAKPENVKAMVGSVNKYGWS